MEHPLIQTKGVWKEYVLGKVKLTVLRDVNVAIRKGSFVAIVGQSGSGKSTLLNIISALDAPTRGAVLFDGKDISSFSDDELANIRGKRVGFVFQQFNLLRQLSALENVTVPAVFQEMPEQERTARAKAILESVGLGHRLSHRPAELSGGEQQRVAVARALINDPEVVVADEPTGNVDSKTGERIMEILSNLHQKEGRTIIIVTHDMALGSRAQEVIRLKDGQIVS